MNTHRLAVDYCTPNSGNGNNVRNLNPTGNLNNNNANNSNGVAPDCGYAGIKVSLFQTEINAITQGTANLSCRKQAKTILDAVCFQSKYALYTSDQFSTIYMEKHDEQSDVKDIVCSFRNLYKAMFKCSRNVRWKDSVSGFLYHGLVNINKLRNSLYDGTYQISKYTRFKVYEPKERDIVSTRFKDRIFQRSLCDHYLYNQISRSFIYDNVACQIGKGTIQGRDRLLCMMQRFWRKHGLNGFVYKFDLKDYFGSTKHNIAFQAVSCRTDDEWAEQEVHRIVSSFNQGEDPTVGMGLGSEPTQLIQLALLDDLDHYIKEQLHIKYYVRYMDDFILIHEDKEYLKHCGEKISTRITALSLRLSQKKTQLSPFTQPIRFLGFSFRITETGKVVRKLLPEKVSHERRRLKRLVALSKQGIIPKSHVYQCYESWKAHAAYGDTHHLVLQMDQYFKNLWRDDHVQVQKCQNASDGGTEKE